MIKRNSLEVGIEKAHQRFEDAVEKAATTRLGFLFTILDGRQEQLDCIKNIICKCQRRSCPAWTPSTTTFWRRMREL